MQRMLLLAREQGRQIGFEEARQAAASTDEVAMVGDPLSGAFASLSIRPAGGVLEL
jgi:hypothetical protein